MHVAKQCIYIYIFMILQGLQVLYPIKRAQCIFVRSGMHSLADNLEYLWNHKVDHYYDFSQIIKLFCR